MTLTDEDIKKVDDKISAEETEKFAAAISKTTETITKQFEERFNALQEAITKREEVSAPKQEETPAKKEVNVEDELKAMKDDFQKQIDSISLRKSVSTEDVNAAAAEEPITQEQKREKYWNNADKHDREWFRQNYGIDL